MENSQENQSLISDKIPLKEKIFYGIGAFMDGGGVAMMSCVMLKYMTTMGIAMAIASTIMMNSFPKTIIVNNDLINKNTVSGAIRLARTKALSYIMNNKENFVIFLFFCYN